MKAGQDTSKDTSRAVAATVAGTVRPVVLSVVVSFLAVGCGGGSSVPATCGVAPCGGNVVGDWTASSVCVDPAALSMDILPAVKGSCADVSIGDVSMTPTGTLSLAADMSFTGSLMVGSAIDIIYPASCLSGATCDDVARPLQSIVGTAGITAVSCVGTGSCTCTLMQTIAIVNATGTWATSGTMLTFAGAPGGDGPYCVQGSSLHMIGLDATTMTKVANDIVLTKS